MRHVLPLLACALLAAAPLALGACGDGGTAEAQVPGCLCEDGRTGATVWCEACKKGWIDGKTSLYKREVLAALAADVRENAEAQGLSGEDVEHRIAEIAAGIGLEVEAPSCGCSKCASKKEAAPAAAKTPEDAVDAAVDAFLGG